jgi:hypothetical protein
MDNYRESLLRGIDVNKSENELRLGSWYNISTYHNLSEEFIKEFKDKVFWKSISKNQILSESFIREFENRVSWIEISRRFVFSFDFLNEFKEKIIWDKYLETHKIEFTTMKRFISKSGYTNINQFNTTHLTEYQKNEIKKIINLKNIF